MRYIIIRTVERSTVIIGQANKKRDAFAIMKNDFKHFFWEKIGYSTDISFDNAYIAYCFDDYKIKADAAFLNACNGYDYDWAILDTRKHKDSLISLPARCYIS